MKEILKELRLQNRYSQELLAKVLGISRQAYMKYESGEVEPSVEVVRRLSKIYKVSYEYLIDNGKPFEHTKNSVVQYGYNEAAWNVASATPAYSVSPAIETGSGLYENLQFLKQIINSMEKQIGSDVKKTETTAKSRCFNKSAFFSVIGELNLDSTYIDELRENSLI